jgi:hypothetical protein
MWHGRGFQKRGFGLGSSSRLSSGLFVPSSMAVRAKREGLVLGLIQGLVQGSLSHVEWLCMPKERGFEDCSLG